MHRHLTTSFILVALLGAGLFVFTLPSIVISAASNVTATIGPVYPAPATPGPTQAGMYPPPQTIAPNQHSQESQLAAQSAPAATPTEAMTWEAQVAVAYVAKAQGIPAEALWVVNEQPANYPNLNRQFHAFKIFDSRPDGKTYMLLVDVNTREVIADTTALDAAEAQARVIKYGKLKEYLYDMIQPLKDTDKVRVLIWIALPPGQSMDEMRVKANAMIVSKYPEASVSVEKYGFPYYLPDGAFSRKIQDEFQQLLESAFLPQMQPLIRALEVMGYAPTHDTGNPILLVELTKQDLLQIAQRKDVEAIDNADIYRPIQNMDIPTQAVKNQLINKNNPWWVVPGASLVVLSGGIVFWVISKRKLK